MSKKNFENAFQFKITLKDTAPPVWRRLLIGEDATFWELHIAIQDAMGWTDSHLHNFLVLNHTTQDWETIAVPHEEDFEPVIDETNEKISNWFGKKIKQCRYIYDFGDNWEHIVLFERMIPTNDNNWVPGRNWYKKVPALVVTDFCLAPHLLDKLG